MLAGFSALTPQLLSGGSTAAGAARALPALLDRIVPKNKDALGAGARWLAGQAEPAAKEEAPKEKPADEPPRGDEGPAAGTSSKGEEQTVGDAAKEAYARMESFGAGAAEQFQSFAQSATGASTSGGSATARPDLGTMWERVRAEVQEAIMPKEEFTSAIRARENVPEQPQADPDAPTGIVVVEQEKSQFRKGVDEMLGKFATHPIAARMRALRSSAAVRKAEDAAADVREKLETSDHPMMHRIWDLQDRLFAENEMARALRMIRTRDPFFDMPRFLATVKQDVKVVIKAYLEGDEEVIQQFCNDAMVERLTGIAAAQKQLGHVSDSTILETGDMELADVKLHPESGQPVVICQFTCQQINCVRDGFGNIVEGGPDEVQRVYYLWALEQEEAGVVGADGKLLPPRWMLVEMAVRGMQQLL